MNIEQIEYCRRRVREEERLGAAASSSEIAERHQQMAMLYKVQLRVLERKRDALHPASAPLVEPLPAQRA